MMFGGILRCVAAPLVLPAMPMTLLFLEQHKEQPVIVESAIRVSACLYRDDVNLNRSLRLVIVVPTRCRGAAFSSFFPRVRTYGKHASASPVFLRVVVGQVLWNLVVVPEKGAVVLPGLPLVLAALKRHMDCYSVVLAAISCLADALNLNNAEEQVVLLLEELPVFMLGLEKYFDNPTVCTLQDLFAFKLPRICEGGGSHFCCPYT